jgi:hypothetical protein
MQAMFNTALQNIAATYFTGKPQKADKTAPMEEFNNLNLEEDASSSDSDSSGSEKD